MFRSLFLLFIFISLAGCNLVRERPSAERKGVNASVYARQAREKEMQARWEGKSLQELTAVMGKPEMVMSIPRYGWPPSAAVVFGVDQATGCIDAFLVVAGKPDTVYNYFCR